MNCSGYTLRESICDEPGRLKFAIESVVTVY